MNAGAALRSGTAEQQPARAGPLFFHPGVPHRALITRSYRGSVIGQRSPGMSEVFVVESSGDEEEDVPQHAPEGKKRMLGAVCYR